MSDTYDCFLALKRKEKHSSFRVRLRRRRDATIVVAPHGGKIEPGTSEVAEAIAGADFAFYAFEGTKASHNGALHITSTRFDEPRCRALVTSAPRVVTIHGEASLQKIVFLGGQDTHGRRRVRELLERRGFVVKTHPNRGLQGLQPKNICNQGTLGRGIQLELSKGLRQSFFRSLTTNGRTAKTKRFWEFVDAVRDGLS